ncbi:MAG: DUF2171 domain-containing protein [Novosphingobium sp.]
MTNQNTTPNSGARNADQSQDNQPATTAQQRQQDGGSRQDGARQETRQAGYAAGQQNQFDAGDNESFRSQVREHMEVIDANGDHCGTVDSIDGDRIKLTREDSGDGQHHYVEFGQVAGIEGGRLRLGETGQAGDADANAADNSRA